MLDSIWFTASLMKPVPANLFCLPSDRSEGSVLIAYEKKPSGMMSNDTLSLMQGQHGNMTLIKHFLGLTFLEETFNE